jgi:hypothetical protein
MTAKDKDKLSDLITGIIGDIQDRYAQVRPATNRKQPSNTGMSR